MSRPRSIALLLALVTLLVYLPVGTYKFVDYDDTDYVTANPVVKQGLTWPGIQWAFDGFHASNWHPLTWISHMVDYSLFSLNAGAHHFVNVLMHAANVALVFLLLWRLTKRLWPAALVAAVFAWHPMHVESVAWIAERKDVLSTFFGLLMLLSYCHYAQGKGRGRLGWALLFFTLGLLAKPMLVTFPFVLLLLDYWPLGRLKASTVRTLLIEKIPFFVLTLISCIITFGAQKNGEAVISLTKMSLGYRLANVPVGIATYLQKLIWPTDLCVLYPLSPNISGLHVALAVGLLLVISLMVWCWRQTRPYCLIGWLWFLGTLVPVIGLVQVGNQAIADRYTYIPSIGLFMAVIFLAADLANRWQTPPIIRFGAAGILCCACILGLEKQLPFWRNSETLFRRAVAVTSHNNIAMVNLGVALDAEGKFDQALKIYYQAEKQGCDLYQLHNNIGNVLDILGHPAESLQEYRKALALRPNSAQLHAKMGDELAQLKRFDEALKELAIAEKLAPNYLTAHMDAAKVLFKIGQDQAGLAELHQVLQLAPDNYQTLATIAHYLAANANVSARNPQAALRLALKADELSGHVQPVVQDFLGMAYAANGDFSNAVQCAQKAIEMGSQAELKSVDDFKKRLALYQNQRPWHESFQTTNAPYETSIPRD